MEIPDGTYEKLLSLVCSERGDRDLCRELAGEVGEALLRQPITVEVKSELGRKAARILGFPMFPISGRYFAHVGDIILEPECIVSAAAYMGYNLCRFATPIAAGESCLGEVLDVSLSCKVLVSDKFVGIWQLQGDKRVRAIVSPLDLAYIYYGMVYSRAGVNALLVLPLSPINILTMSKTNAVSAAPYLAPLAVTHDMFIDMYVAAVSKFINQTSGLVRNALNVGLKELVAVKGKSAMERIHAAVRVTKKMKPVAKDDTAFITLTGFGYVKDSKIAKALNAFAPLSVNNGEVRLYDNVVDVEGLWRALSPRSASAEVQGA